MKGDHRMFGRINRHDLYLLPTTICNALGLREYRARVDVVKELGGESVGPAPFSMGLIYSFSNGAPQEWVDFLNLIEWH